jgi:peptidoglycan hydrolase CwlO-like protein
VLVTVVAGIPPVRADEVDDQRRRVEQIADELDALDNQLGELEEAHAAALDRIDQLAIEIQDAQAGVDAQSAELATLQGQLADIAVDKFMSGGSSGLTPLFSSAEGFTDDLERSELARVALDQGAGTSDEMQVLVEQLTEDKAALDAKKNEQTQLVASLETQQQQGEALTVELQQKYAAAQTELGQAIVEEQERRAAAAAAAAQARFAAAAAAQQQAAASSTARGGGGTATPTTGGTAGATTAPSGGSSDAPVAAPTPGPVGPGAGVHRRYRHQRGAGSARRAVQVRCVVARRRVRLLRPHEVRVGQGRRVPPASVGGAVRIHPACAEGSGTAGRPDLLLLADRTRGHVPRRRDDDPCARDG